MTRETPLHLGQREQILGLERYLFVSVIITTALVMLFTRSFIKTPVFGIAMWVFCRGLGPQDPMLPLFFVLAWFQKPHYSPVTDK